MPVRFVLGRAGTGKTRHFLEQIQALVRPDPLGPPIYLLLPKQATFLAERWLTLLVLPVALAIVGLHVLTPFSSTLRRIAASARSTPPAFQSE